MHINYLNPMPTIYVGSTTYREFVIKSAIDDYFYDSTNVII